MLWQAIIKKPSLLLKVTAPSLGHSCSMLKQIFIFAVLRSGVKGLRTHPTLFSMQANTKYDMFLYWSMFFLKKFVVNSYLFALRSLLGMQKVSVKTGSDCYSSQNERIYEKISVR